MNKQNNLILGVIVALVIGGAVGFFAGMQYQKSQRLTLATGSGARGQFGAGGAGRFGGANGANRPVMGQIISADSKSITVKLADGSSKIVLFTGSTSINKADTATSSDLKSGETVAAFGTANSDGSVTASNIQLNPQMRGFGRGVSPTSAK